MLDVQVRLQLAEFALDATLAAPRGAVTVLVGESGSGKSTLLRLVTGLLAPDAGRITLGGRVLADREAGTWVPPEARPVGWVPQDYALFPHLDARENVAFGLAASGVPARARRARADAALERLGIAPLAHRRPRELSGGQQQRVALARALVLEPEVLLLDEPLAALDLVTRRAVRGELRRLLASLPCVTLLVTHDPAEALALGDRIAALESGRVTQAGERAEFVRHPRSRYVAEFLGVNLFEGAVERHGAGDAATLAVAGGTLTIPDPGRDGAVRVLVHPHDVTLSAARPSSSARNVLAGTIVELVPEPPDGERVRVLIDSRPPLAAQVTRGGAEALGLVAGGTVWASFKATAVIVLPD